MRHHAFIPLVAAVANGIMCLPILRQSLRTPRLRPFAGLTLTIVAWNLDIFALYYFRDLATAARWSLIFRTGVCLAPAAAFHAALDMAESRRWPWNGLLALAYATGVFLAVANACGALVARLSPHPWGWYVEGTPLYRVFSALILACLVLTLQRVWNAYRHPSSPRQRTQAQFWLLATGIQTPFAFSNLLPVYGLNVYPLGNVGNIFFVGIVAYAIARHRLMDVDYVVRKGSSFLLAATCVLVPGGLLLNLVARAVARDVPVVFVCTALALALAAVILVPTLQRALETRLHQAFFPQLYDSRRRLRTLASEMVHVLDRGELVRRLAEGLDEILDVESCEVFVREDGIGPLVLAHPPGPTRSLGADVGQALETLAGPVLASEVEEERPALSAAFRAAGWELVLPLRVKRRLTGLVALGRRRDFRIFSGEDVQLLATVAAGASVALENASLSRQLRRSEVVLERANRLSSLGLLAAGIAHEIRNPLVAVKTFLDLLPQRLDDREFLTDFRELSLGELRRVTDLITDMLALGKSKTAERRAVDLGATLEPVVRLMESTARKREIEVFALCDGPLPLVWADPDQVKQIVLNLLLNAIETSAAGGRVTLAVRRGSPDGVVLEVSDRGPGIPPERLEMIFHPFFTTKEAGTGLGLALVHQMVVEHGGDIAVESEPGRGTTFRVTLPAARSDLAPTGT